MKTIALLTFIAVYALLLLLPKYRAVSALSAAALFLLLRIVPPVGPAGSGAAQREMAHHRAGTVRGAGIRLCG